MLGVQCAVSLRWSASIGDVQAAFLSGVAAPIQRRESCRVSRKQS